MCRIFFFLLLLVSIACPDRVFVKNGTIVEGDIIARSDAIVKIFMENHQRAIAIEKEYIDSIEYEGRITSFDKLSLQKKTDYNPAFKVTPVVRKVNPRQQHELFKKDPFEAARKSNYEADSRKENLLFNAPVRWGSAGMGYAVTTNVSAEGGGGYAYDGSLFDVRSIVVAMRYNIGKKAPIPGTFVAEFGYGKAHLDERDEASEIAVMRHLSFRYVFCNPKWLVAPGLSIGCIFQNGAVTRKVNIGAVHSGETTLLPEKNFNGSGLQPLAGIDLNVYDVIALHVAKPFFTEEKGRIHASLLFLIPFRI